MDDSIVPRAWWPGLIRARDKGPFEKEWQKRAAQRWREAPDRGWYQGIEEFLADGGTANVAMTPPPGVVALDADNKEAVQLLQQYRHEETPWQQRHDASAHAWFRYQLAPGVEWLNKGVKIGEAAIDLRVACKGVCIIPPSRHKDGTPYQWETEFPERLADVPEMSDELRDKLIEAGAVPTSMADRIIPDGRNAHDTVRDHIMSIAFRCESVDELMAAGEQYARYYVEPRRPDRFRQMTTSNELKDLVEGAWERRDDDRMQALGHGDERFSNLWQTVFSEHWAYTGDWNSYEWLEWDAGKWQGREVNGPDGFMGALQRFTERVEHLVAIDDVTNADHHEWCGQLLTMSGALSRSAASRGPIERLKARMAIAAREFDSRPNLWLCPEVGAHRPMTIDFKEAEVRSPRRTDYMTKSGRAPFVPGAKSKVWENFLKGAFPDPSVRAYVQTAMGYSLLGNPTEDAVFYVIGVGGSGKSTFLNTLLYTFGDYAGILPASEINDNQPSTGAGGANASLVDLAGRRLVISPELPETVRLGAKLKGLTGGDTITARRPYARVPVSFTPQFVLWLGGNLQPRADAVDTGLQRRLVYIPMDSVPSKVDTQLKERLREPDAQAAILQWAIAGLQRFQTMGLVPPKDIMDRTNLAHQEASAIGGWLEEHVAPDEDADGFTAQEALASFRLWWMNSKGSARGCPIATVKRMSTELVALGMRSKASQIKGVRGRRYKGFRLLEEHEVIG